MSRFNAIKRDLVHFAQALAGGRPEPVLRRGKALTRSKAAATTWTNAALVARTEITPQAVALEFKSSNGPLPVAAAGQFATFEIALANAPTPVKRAYSIVSQPSPDSLVVVVKRVENGLVSNALHSLPLGSVVRLRAPLGLFTVDPQVGRQQEYLFVAAGSGITPIYAMIRALLAGEPRSTLTLIYGNRSEQETIYRSELQALASKSEGRLAIRFVDEKATETTFVTGQLCNDVMHSSLSGLRTPQLAYLCGPTVVMTQARDLLQQRGLASSQIFEERFGSPTQSASESQGVVGIARTATVRSPLGVRRFEVLPTQTLLEAAAASGVVMPSSCTMGGCGACKVSVVSGSLLHDEPNCLSESERATGKALACVARLRSDAEVIVS